MGNKMINWKGFKIGRLTVIENVGKDKYGHYKWLCKCECGNETIVFSGNLKRNHTTSCGCVHEEVFQKIRTKHGMRHTDFYSVWCSMKQRCYDINNKNYNNYGGRGINICDRWLEFTNFYDDMFSTYKKGLSIDRIDVNGNYEFNNCKWATYREQGCNKRNTIIVTYKGETDALITICRKYLLNYKAIMCRIYNLKWDYEKALNTPIKKREKRTAII